MVPLAGTSGALQGLATRHKRYGVLAIRTVAGQGIAAAVGIVLAFHGGGAWAAVAQQAVGTGLYITELIGFGVNTVTGDYSRGAAGLWIENGKLSYPVAEITVAGQLSDMLKNIIHIGSDLEFRGSTCAPTIAIANMTISGK